MIVKTKLLIILSRLALYSIIIFVFIATPVISAENKNTDESIFFRSIAHNNPDELNKFNQKIDLKQPITIGFIGGSITEGYVSSKPEFRYSSSLTSSLQNHYRTKITELNAGIGATGSLLGIFRLNRDIINYRPDLVIIEFAVNDGETIEEKIAYESMIINLKRNNIAVIALYLMRDNGSNQQIWQAEIAKKYDIPAISYRDAYYPLIENHSINRTDLFYDSVHPNDGGHNKISELLFSYIVYSKNNNCNCKQNKTNIYDFYFGNDFIDPKVHLYGDNTVKLINNIGFSPETITIRNIFKHDGFKTEKANDIYEFEFYGSYFGLLYHIMNNEKYGAISVYIDDQFVATLNSFYTADNENWHIIPKILKMDLPNEKHKVKIINAISSTNPNGSYFQIQVFFWGDSLPEKIYLPSLPCFQ